MDTDQLTEMAYEIIRLAGEASGCLRAEIGAACSEFRSEDDYLHAVLAHVRSIEEAPQDYASEWNLPDDEEAGLPAKLRELRLHVERTLATPIVERGEPEF